MKKLGRYRDGDSAHKKIDLSFYRGKLILVRMFVNYCSACATLRELKVSEVQQTVNNTITI
jgi:hypothetical protein